MIMTILIIYASCKHDKAKQNTTNYNKKVWLNKIKKRKKGLSSIPRLNVFVIFS